jgi:hypothetical protein
MKLGIMQPYFLPYIGYFQLISAVDVFVIYDNIKYTKKGWINRNRMLVNGEDVMFSLPLRADSDHLDVCERELMAGFTPDKLLNQFKGAYLRAPHFEQTFAFLELILRYEERNLFRFLRNAIQQTCRHIGITTDIRTSSEITIDHELKGQEKVLALCEALGATAYLNAIGGQDLYSRERFREHCIDLSFIKSLPLDYPQLGAAFVPWLSIADVLMFNSIETIHTYVSTNYELI